jgi:hypothetical protein
MLSRVDTEPDPAHKATSQSFVSDDSEYHVEGLRIADSCWKAPLARDHNGLLAAFVM